MLLQCSTGSVEANVGDTFKRFDGSEHWEIIGFPCGGSYSPSTLGETSTVRCKPLHGLPTWYRQYTNEDGTVDLCADSVAAMMLSAIDGTHRSARGDLLTK